MASSRYTGAMCAALLMLSVELFVRSGPIWRDIPRSTGGAVDALETEVIAPAQQPKVVVLGSSRMRDAVAPREVERALGLAPKSVLNLGMTSGSAVDALSLYRRSRATLGRARVLVLGVDDWYFNRGMPLTARDHRLLGARERLAFFEGEQRWQLAASWAFRTYGARTQLRRWLEGGHDDRVVLAEDGRVKWRQNAPAEGPESVEVAAQLRVGYSEYSFNDDTHRVIEELVELARADGLEVWIVQVPLRDRYLREAAQRHPGAFEHYRRAVERLPADHRWIEWGAEAAGFPNTEFLDYGHLTARGAVRYSQRLAARIRRSVVP